jgi:hypothetical protein
VWLVELDDAGCGCGCGWGVTGAGATALLDADVVVEVAGFLWCLCLCFLACVVLAVVTAEVADVEVVAAATEGVVAAVLDEADVPPLELELPPHPANATAATIVGSTVRLIQSTFAVVLGARAPRPGYKRLRPTPGASSCVV